MTDVTIDETSPLIFPNTRATPPSDHRSLFERKLSIWLILLSAGFERLAFYSLASNLVLFLTSNNIHWTPIHSVTASFIFLGTSHISALLFAWISDGKLGRAKTIIIGFILYIVGYVIISLISDKDQYHLYDTFCKRSATFHHENDIPFHDEQCFAPILTTLIVTAIGVGAVQANMAVFGAEQLREQKATTQYFDRYYAIINMGGLIAFGFIAYAQQNNSFFLGYIVPSSLLVFALFLFLVGYRYYIHVPPYDSVINHFIPVLCNAIKTWRKYRRYTRASLTTSRNPSGPNLFRNSIDASEQLSTTLAEQSWSFLDYAKASNQGRFVDRIVEDIKSLRRVIVVFLLLTPYWLLYFQIETTFLIQGVHMRVPKFFQTTNNAHYMPVIWLSLANQIIIIVTIFVLNTFIYKRLYASGRTLSLRSRLVIGMIAATLAMCFAGIVEIFRQKECRSAPPIYQIIGKTNYSAADMTIFYQIPQYIGIGFSEVFTSVASLEFAYLAAPRSAQSLIMSLRFCSAGLSSFIGLIYVGVFVRVKRDFTFDNFKCSADNQPESFYIYFFVLAAVQLIFVLIFYACDRRYQWVKVLKRNNTRLFLTSDSRLSTG